RMKNVDVLWFDHDCTYEDNIKNKHKKTRMEIFDFKKECIITPKEYANRALSVGSRDISFGWNGMIDFNFLKKIKLKFINFIINEDI
ncbi:glycosyltransferase family 2 protein, partial [Campylobacter jejuni]